MNRAEKREAMRNLRVRGRDLVALLAETLVRTGASVAIEVQDDGMRHMGLIMSLDPRVTHLLTVLLDDYEEGFYDEEEEDTEDEE